jgi:hypothetical protein
VREYAAQGLAGALGTVSSVTFNPSASPLPGADLVERGLHDLVSGVDSPEALLVSIGAPRLRRLGLQVARPLPMPEHRLYKLLSDQYGNAAHSRYNALVRRLVSYERAAGAVRLPNA